MRKQAKVPIIRRRVRIPFDDADAQAWLASEKDIQDVLNNVSFVFPPGEKFFIQSVQYYHDRITDPVLKEQVRDFVFQEAMHSKEHARANERLAESFSEGAEIERGVGASLALISRYTPHATQLAFTCALEHFTAILSHNLLKWQEPFIAKSDPAFAAMWLWHAVEEAEHKAVCFDVYQEVCGKGVFSYLHRVAVMLAVTVAMPIMFFTLARMKKKDKAAAAAAPAPVVERSHAASSAKARPQPTLWQKIRSLVPSQLYFDYFRPSFHPWDTDDTEFIEEWKRRYRDFPAITDLAPAGARA